MADQARAAFEAGKLTFASLATGLKDLQWEQLPHAVMDYIKANPRLTGFEVLCLLLVAVPGIVATPALLSLGFGTAGPIAGTPAPAFQSAYGAVTGFSALQSAAMGGWGVPIVNGIVQAGAAVAGLAGVKSKL